MLLTQSDIEKKYKINRSTVCRWVKNGKLAADEHGMIVETDFLNVFRRSVAWKKMRDSQSAEIVQKVTGDLPLNEPNQLTGEPGVIPNVGYTPQKASGEGEGFGAESVSTSNVDLAYADKALLDRMKAVEDVRERKRKNNLAEGKLVQRAVVRRFMAGLESIDNTQWRSLSSRVCDDILAACEVSGSEIALKVTERIDQEVFLILNNTQRLQAEYLHAMQAPGE